MKHLFSINSEFFNFLGYSMSYIEFFGVVSGLAAIWLAARAHIWSWPVGLVNVVLSFFLYFQVQLYPDMLLQVFFFVTNMMGWWRWSHPKKEEADKKNELKVSYMSRGQLVFTIVAGIAGTFLLGGFASRLHDWFPVLFSLPSAYPYIDSFIMTMSIITTFFMIQKKIESWIIWILVDIVATYLYYIKGIKFYSLEYLIFTGIAAYGLYHWVKEYRSYARA